MFGRFGGGQKSGGCGQTNGGMFVGSTVGIGKFGGNGGNGNGNIGANVIFGACVVVVVGGNVAPGRNVI